MDALLRQHQHPDQYCVRLALMVVKRLTPQLLVDTSVVFRKPLRCPVLKIHRFDRHAQPQAKHRIAVYDVQASRPATIHFRQFDPEPNIMKRL